MKGRREIAYDRVREFMTRLKKCFMGDCIEAEAEVYVTPLRLKLEETVDLERRPIGPGEKWGENWDSAYYRLIFRIPDELKDCNLAAKLNLGGEMLVYDESGEPLYGLSNHSVYDDSNVKNIHLVGSTDKDEIVMFVETAANELFGLDMDKHLITRKEKDAEGHRNGVYAYAILGRWQEDIWNLHQDMEVLLSLYESLDEGSTRAVRILSALFEAANAYSEHGALFSAGILGKVLGTTNGSDALSTTAIGHAHIDTAWLWPLAETHRKVARTFASQMDNIDSNPAYIFGASSPQQYLWTKNEHPGLYGRIRKAIADGRWELLGGMWVEPDCNLISGESFVRQFLYGKRFFMKEFGKDVKTCWIPDVFGYPASMPQLLKRAGIDCFITIKMSWSKNNKFPYDTFIWKGLDDSEVLVHFPPEHDYNSKALPKNLIAAERNFAEKDRLDEFLTLAGIGDGGGGPKAEHLERIMRQGDLAGVPKASWGHVEDFVGRLEKKKDLLMRYKGELYLEYHRGTYTSQAAQKRNNRLFEENLKLVEALYADRLDEYPDLGRDIEDALTLQFHDILPGSSITKVYEESTIIYRRIFDDFRRLVEARAEGAEAIHTSFFERKADRDPKFITFFNPGMEAKDSILLEIPAIGEGNGRLGDYPVSATDGRSFVLMPLKSGWTCLPFERTSETCKKDSGTVLENEDVIYRFGEDGTIVEAKDKKRGEDLFQKRVANILSLYHDEPHTYEAWDIDFYYKDMVCNDLEPCGRTERTVADAFSSITFLYRTKASSIRQTIVLPAKGYQLFFTTFVEWHDERKLLRVSFPVDSNVEYADCDIAYGTTGRKTHVQNEWDFAKFEFPARNFVNVGELALSSDSKYGYAARDGELSMSLLRSPIYPDPHADMGRHEFTYSIIPHPGKQLDESDVRMRASFLSAVPLSFCTEHPIEEKPLVYSLENSGCSIGALKKAEDGKHLAIRIVEMEGKKQEVRIMGKKNDIALVETDLLERPLKNGLRLEKDPVFTIGPYEIRTFVEQ